MGAGWTGRGAGEVRCVCLSATHVSFCFFVVLSELRTVLLQTRLLFECDFGGRCGHAGVCACLSKRTNPSCLICCLCFALAQSMLLLVADAKTVVFSIAGSVSCSKKISNAAVQGSIPASSTGFDPHVLPEVWPLAGLVGCVGWPRRSASLVVCGASASWRVGLAVLQEGRLCEGILAGQWAESGASASPSECSDPLHYIC